MSDESALEVGGTKARSKPLGARVEDLTKLLGAGYVIGFIVILTHTARLHAPVVLAFEFQNIMAGLPVWLLVLVAVLFWPLLSRPLRTRPDGSVSTDDFPVATLLAIVAVAGACLLFVFRWLTGLPILSRHGLVAASVILWLCVTTVEAQLLFKPRFNALYKRIVFISWLYSGLLSITLAYACYLYPLLPQSLGGGRPEQVRLLLKKADLLPVLGGFQPANEHELKPITVTLYYRTESFLLLSAGENQSLVQVPMEQVGALVWLNSRTR